LTLQNHSLTTSYFCNSLLVVKNHNYWQVLLNTNPILSILWHITYILLDFGQSMNLDSQTMPCVSSYLMGMLLLPYFVALPYWLHLCCFLCWQLLCFGDALIEMIIQHAWSAFSPKFYLCMTSILLS